VPVILGRDFGAEVEVARGLDGSESVILNPPDSLASGQTVRIAGDVKPALSPAR
jgi:hypothetical protein